MSNRGPLGDLIESVKAANDWSYQGIADRANRKLGPGSLSKQTVSRFANEYPLKSAPRDALYALAAGLGISPNRVALEAMRAMGFEPPDASPSAAEAVQRDPALSDPTRRAVLAILRDAARGSA